MEIKNVNISSTRGGDTPLKSTSSGVTSTPGNVPVTKVASASMLSSMSKGSIFAGDIIDVQNSTIKILLSGNETVTAKSANSSNLNIGDYIRFMVKDNTGSQILIKALNVDNRNTNPLFNALEQANIPVNERNMQMVHEMMRNEMPIDKASIYDMYKNISMFESAKADTIVNIVRHNIPLNSENIAQFDNYTNYEHRISEEIKSISKDIPEFLKDSLTHSNSTVIKELAVKLISDYKDGALSLSTSNKELNLVANEDINVMNLSEDNLYQIKLTDNTSDIIDDSVLGKNLVDNNAINSDTVDNNSNSSTAISEEFAGIIDKIKEKVANTSMFKDLDISGIFKDNIVDKASLVKAILVLDKEDLHTLFDTKEFKKYIDQAFEKEFNIDVLKLTSDGEELKEKLDNLYNSLDEKTAKLLELIKSHPNDNDSLNNKLNNLRNNLNFMSEINQMASYVQLPLKFSEATNHGELYVYNKNRKGNEEKDVLTAFMHLDMDNLGVTDVDIRLENNNLTTTFSLNDDMSVNIVEEHLHELKDRLIKAGFTVSLSVKKEEVYENPFDKVLEMDRPKMSIKRYSFDVRA